MYNHTELTMLAAQAGHSADDIEAGLKPLEACENGMSEREVLRFLQ